MIIALYFPSSRWIAVVFSFRWLHPSPRRMALSVYRYDILHRHCSQSLLVTWAQHLQNWAVDTQDIPFINFQCILIVVLLCFVHFFDVWPIRFDEMCMSLQDTMPGWVTQDASAAGGPKFLEPGPEPMKTSGEALMSCYTQVPS